ncbi:MAG TPA: GntR family transcriptional regulator [Rectinemataceae bacterium]
MLTQTSARPLYEQLKQALIGHILAGDLSYGDRLPGELALAEQYGISRITVRRALAELQAQGYLDSQQGRGTFVSYRHVHRHLRTFGGFSESFDDGKKNKTSHILSKEIVKADLDVAENLRIEPGTAVLHLKRIMADSSVPYMVDNAYFVESMYPGLADLLEDDISTFQLMRSRYGIVFAKAYKTLAVIRADAGHAELLKCVPGDPLFSISKVIYDPKDTPVHYSHYLVLGDRCVYTLTVSGDQPDMELKHQDPKPGNEA